MDTEQTQRQVSRDEVFKLASLILDLEAKVPSLRSIREQFETPTSPAIAVYFSEWKSIRQDDIAKFKRTPTQLRKYAERLQGEIADISAHFKMLRLEYDQFTEFCKLNHPYILSEWENYRPKD